MAKYKITEPENFNKYEQLARISFNIRYYTKIWKEHYGVHNRKFMKYWEVKLDEWIKANIEADIAGETIEDQAINTNESWRDFR